MAAEGLCELMKWVSSRPMHIIFLKFSANKSQASELMDAHKAWLKRGFDDGVFLLAGSLEPGDERIDGGIAVVLTLGGLARHAGVAPLDASSGKHQRHRLDRGGNRQLNCALHRIAVTHGRVHGPARAYLDRKQGEGKSRREALRCLKRQLARTVYTTLKSEPLLT